MKITPEQLVQNLSDSGLMSADEASSLCSSLSTVAGPTDANTVIQELVGSGKLTAFQAECICRGEIAGLVVDEYVVLDKIGQGGMGVVLKAYHGRLDRLAAVKKLPPEKMDAPGAVERFHREAKAAARLSHPNVVTVYDAREHDGIHYLIMEYVEGQDLAQLVSRQGPLPVDQAVGYVIQAARGLQYAHDEGIVHRDIKPSNLLLNERGQVKILDMGLALIKKGAGPLGAAAVDPLTTDGQVMGTCDYMAPEQAKSTHDVDRRADIYALGCTLYRLLTGQAPYRGDSLFELLVAHQEADIPSLCDKRPDVPRAVDAVYQRMVAKTPDERYGSMNEFIAALEAAVPGKPVDDAQAPPDPDSNLLTFLGNLRGDPPPTAQFHPQSAASEPAATDTATKPPQTAPKDETVDHAPEADTNRNIAQPAAAEPFPTPTTPSRPRSKRRQRTRMMVWMGIGLTLSLLGIAVLARVIYIRTDYGTIAVNARDRDIEVLVKQDGNQVDIVRREPDGPQELLTYQQFHDHLKKVGFPPPAAAADGSPENVVEGAPDPSAKATEGLPDATSTTPSETDASNPPAERQLPAGTAAPSGDATSYRPPVIEPELVKSFAEADLYQFLVGVVNDKPSDFMLRLLYTEIATTMHREQVGSWRIGAGVTRDGSAYEFSVRNTRWFARRLAPDEAEKMGLSGRSWGRTLNVMWSSPVNKIMELESADVRIETDGDGNRVFVGRIRCRVDAPQRVDYLALVFDTPSPEEGENVTRNLYQYVRPERLPKDEFEVHLPLDGDQRLPAAGRFYFQAFLFEPEASFYRISNELVWVGPPKR